MNNKMTPGEYYWGKIKKKISPYFYLMIIILVISFIFNYSWYCFIYFWAGYYFIKTSFISFGNWINKIMYQYYLQYEPDKAMQQYSDWMKWRGNFDL